MPTQIHPTNSIFQREISQQLQIKVVSKLFLTASNSSFYRLLMKKIATTISKPSSLTANKKEGSTQLFLWWSSWVTNPTGRNNMKWMLEEQMQSTIMTSPVLSNWEQSEFLTDITLTQGGNAKKASISQTSQFFQYLTLISSLLLWQTFPMVLHNKPCYSSHKCRVSIYWIKKIIKLNRMQTYLEVWFLTSPHPQYCCNYFLPGGKISSMMVFQIHLILESGRESQGSTPLPAASASQTMKHQLTMTGHGLFDQKSVR